MGGTKGEFTDLLIELNRGKIGDFRNWVFLPGMLFGSQKTWWDSMRKRRNPHEGVDLFLYRTKEGKIRRLSDGIVIPSLFSGTVLSIEPDFLGSSVFILHEETKIFAVGHLALREGLREGKEVRRGEPLGYLMDGKGPSTGVPGHVHLSFASILSWPLEKMNWKLMSDGVFIKLSDPMPYLAQEYELIEKREKVWVK